MEGMEEEKDDEEEEVVGEKIGLMEEAKVEDEGGEISFHALKGGPTGKIIKVKG